jgi:hypothetical protein
LRRWRVRERAGAKIRKSTATVRSGPTARMEIDHQRAGTRRRERKVRVTACAAQQAA